MSNQSARRVKERAGGSASKTLIPNSENPSLISSGRKSIGKENPNVNPRSISRVPGPTQKPVIRPIPRISGVETRSRSQPRGRSASPSDFTRVLSDMRKPRVSSGGNLGRSEVLEKKILKGFNPKAENRSDKVSNLGINGMNAMNLSDEFRKEDTSSVNLAKSISNEAKFGSKRRVGEGSTIREKKVSNLSDEFVNLAKPIGNESKFGSKRRVGEGSGIREKKVGSNLGMNAMNAMNLSDEFRKEETLSVNLVKPIASESKSGSERRVGGTKNEEGSSGRVSSKSASRLHEKLAYLEGKVKRIACDIKKTKEMLDMNNTDASKLILSDIQEKISGIEKAVGNVMADSCSTVSGKSINEKVSVKGLSHQELEARLFPHRKLLRNRSLSKVSETVSNLVENPIEQQFLLNLNNVNETDEPQSSNYGTVSGMQSEEVDLEAHERFDEEVEEQENKPLMEMEVEVEEDEESGSKLIEVGRKTSTGGWFVSEGEAVLLAHDDGSCSFHDIVNYEKKAEYIPPAPLSQNIWRDCWIIRAPGADGCSEKYVVAASAGNTMDSGFCSWDFYHKDVRAFHIEDNTTSPRVPLSQLPDNLTDRRNPLSGLITHETRQWWYKPCGPLIISTASCQKSVKVFDIRDGEEIMKWDVVKPVLSSMDYCSPVQWRNRGKVVIGESDGLSVWDVSSLSSEPVSSVSSSGRRITALHVNNTDAELGGGVRQRISSSEAEGNDGVFCTSDSINILDFRQPSGIGLKIPKIGVTVQSVSSRGDSIFLGCSNNNVTSGPKKQPNSQILQFSIRHQKIVTSYNLPESNAHSHHKALTQVWGNSNWVMAVSGLGLFVFDAQKDDDHLPSIVSNYNYNYNDDPLNVREIIGPDDMYSPSFDYHSSQILLISRDRPAMWRQLS